jgi:thioredoxin-related protein
MKSIFLAVILFLPVSLVAKTLTIGDLMPTLTEEMKITDFNGGSFDWASIKKPAGTLVVFSCNHCPYSVKWEGRIRDIGNKFSKKVKLNNKEYDGIGVVMINSNDWSKNPIDSPAEMKKRSQKLGLEFPYVVDETSLIAAAFGAQKTPEVFLFNGEGRLVYKGAVDDNYNEKKMKTPYLTQAVESLIKGEKISKSETKAIGCSIKSRLKKS